MLNAAQGALAVPVIFFTAAVTGALAYTLLTDDPAVGGAAKGALIGAIAGDAGKGAAAGAVGSVLFGEMRRNR